MTNQEQEKLNAICVFCGAQDAVPAEYLDAGTKMGQALAAAGKTLVYGGGDCGVMGTTANGTLNAGGKVIGVFPRHMREIEKEHETLTEIHLVDTMHERKQMMYDFSDAFAIFPGGCGTMDEMFEIITWRQIGLHNKPVIIFNYNGYWDPLLALLERFLETGFARPATRNMFEVVNTFDELKARLGL